MWKKDEQYKGFMPTPRIGHTAVLYENKIVIFGGEGPNKELFNEIFSYDLSTSTWSKIQSVGSLPAPRSYHTACINQDNMIIFGGIGEDNQFFDTLHSLNLSKKKKKKNLFFFI